MRSIPPEAAEDLVLIVRDGVVVDLEELYAATPSAVPAWVPAAAQVAVQHIEAGLDALAALTPADLPPAMGLETAAALLGVQDRVQALALRAVADVQTRDLYVLDGMPSAGTWVAEQHTSMPRSHVALAGKLDRVPQVADRIAAGGLSVEGGTRIGQALDRLRRHVDRPDGLIDSQPPSRRWPASSSTGSVSSSLRATAVSPTPTLGSSKPASGWARSSRPSWRRSLGWRARSWCSRST